MCSAEMLCCSCGKKSIIVILDVSFPGLKDTPATRGMSMKGRRHAEASAPPPPQYTHSVERAHTQTHYLSFVFLPCSCKSYALRTRLLTVSRIYMSKHVGRRTAGPPLSSQLKHVAQPTTANQCHFKLLQPPYKTNVCVCVTLQPKAFPCSSL